MGTFFESLKDFLGVNKEDGDKPGDKSKKTVWKRINTLMVLAAGGIFLIILANTFSPSTTVDVNNGTVTQKTEEPQLQQPAAATGDITKLENLLAQRLEKVLGQIEGVGKVEITINLASTTEKDYAANVNTNIKDTREHDQKGGTRTISETNENGQMVLVRENQGSKETPVVVKEVKPQVKGVIVVAEGARDPEIKSQLMNAVQVFLDVPLYKVVVLPKESR